ncbi:hypothetical protein BDP67DRAFT_249738 [Colletotrichum lupini]|nr:hypothetical protein BDP67DRAFT_249738 [Colletotrichum lupini]
MNALFHCCHKGICPEPSESLLTPRYESKSNTCCWAEYGFYYSARLRPVPNLSHHQPQWPHEPFVQGLHTCNRVSVLLCVTQTEGSNNVNDLSALRAYQSALRSFICTAWRGGNRALSTSHGVLNLQPSGLDSEPTSTTRIQFGHSPRFPSRGHEMTLFSLRNHGERSRNRIRLQPSITSFRPSNARTRRTRYWLLDERCFSAVTPNPGSVYSPLRRANAFFQRGCPDCMVGEPVSAARLGHSPLRRWLVERYRQPSAIPTTGNQRFHTVFHFPLRPPLQRTFALQMGYDL